MSKIIDKISQFVFPPQMTTIARAFWADTRGFVAIKRWDAVSRFNLSLFKKKGLEICDLLERKEFDKARKLTLEVKELLYRETHIPPHRRTTLHSLLNQLFRFTERQPQPDPFSRSNLDSSRLESLLDQMLEYADNEQHHNNGQEKQGEQNQDLDLEACKQKFETMSIVPQTDPPGFAGYKMKYPKFLSSYSLYLGGESSHEQHEQDEDL